jgi:hypothetical protein
MLAVSTGTVVTVEVGVVRGTVELVVVVELEVALRPKGIWSSPTVRGVSSGDTPQAQAPAPTAPTTPHTTSA